MVYKYRKQVRYLPQMLQIYGMREENGYIHTEYKYEVRWLELDVSIILM